MAVEFQLIAARPQQLAPHALLQLLDMKTRPHALLISLGYQSLP